MVARESVSNPVGRGKPRKRSLDVVNMKENSLAQRDAEDRTRWGILSLGW